MIKTSVNGNKRLLVVNKRRIDGSGFEVAIPLPRRNKSSYTSVAADKQVTTILDSKILTAADEEMKKRPSYAEAAEGKKTN
jgi:hypothetical protein